MSLRTQFRWGGGLVVAAAVLWIAGEVLLRSGVGGPGAHTVYALGAAGLVPAAAFMYVALGDRGGVTGAAGYFLAAIGLLLANVVVFLGLAGARGIAGMDAAAAQAWELLRFAFPIRDSGFLLLGMAAVRTRALPRPAGVLLAIGVLAQLPQPAPVDPAGRLFTAAGIAGATGIAGALLIGAALAWAGAALWGGAYAGDGGAAPLPGLWPGAGRKPGADPSPPVDGTPGAHAVLPEPRRGAWQGPFVILTALIFILNAYANNIGELDLFDGLVNLLGILTLAIAMPLLYADQAHRAGAPGLSGFILVLVGATQMAVPAYLIAAQLAGQLADNRALMASWVDIPIATTGHIMVVLGLFIFGIAAARADVYPRWSGRLIAAGVAMSVPAFVQAQAYFFLIFWAVGATFTGIGLGWMGWTLLRKPPGA